MATRITICCAEDSLFGGDTEGYDVEKSLRRYAAIATDYVHGLYPDAEVETTYQPQMWSVQVAADGDDEDAITSKVENLCTTIHQHCEWAVAAQ